MRDKLSSYPPLRAPPPPPTRDFPLPLLRVHSTVGTTTPHSVLSSSLLPAAVHTRPLFLIRDTFFLSTCRSCSATARAPAFSLHEENSTILMGGVLRENTLEHCELRIRSSDDCRWFFTFLSIDSTGGLCNDHFAESSQQVNEVIETIFMKILFYPRNAKLFVKNIEKKSEPSILSSENPFFNKLFFILLFTFVKVSLKYFYLFRSNIVN